jgi:hypothetical protein
MATDSRARLEQLHAKARELVQQKRFKDANQALAEASSIASSDPAFADGWAAKIGSAKGDAKLVTLCKTFVKSKVDSDADSALDYVKSHLVPDGVVGASMETLMGYAGDSDSADELTGLLLEYLPAKQILANALKASPTVTFNKIFERGDDSTDGQTNLLLSRTGWPSEKDRIAAERDVFQLALAQLMKAGQDFPERAMRTISRLLGAEASNLNGLIDADGFDIILSNLDIRLPNALRAQASLACVKLMELSPDTAKTLISQYVVDRVQTPSGERLVQAFSAAAAVFPMAPHAAAELFLRDGFLPNFVKLIDRWSSERVVQAALELLDSVCMHSQCREAIRKYCPEWLHSISTMVDSKRGQSQSALANLILEKIRDQAEGEKSPSDIDQHAQERARRFTSLIMEENSSRLRAIAFEGLAFASIRPKVKDELVHDAPFLKRLIQLLGGEAEGASVFGGLSVLASLSKYRVVLSEEQKKMAELRAYAAPVKPAPPGPLDDEVHVTERCNILLHAGVVTLFIKRLKSWSPPSKILAIQIMLSLAHDKRHRGQLVQQGALKLLLATYDDMAVNNDPMEPVLLAAAHAAAKILISVNPAHAFTSASPSMSSAVRPLATLLTPVEKEDSTVDFLPTFEALIALTNLASVDESICNLIIKQAWAPIEDLLLCQNVLVQRAATELVCNLSGCQQGAALFAASKQSRSRVLVLLALSDAADVPTRSAASGALAQLTELEPVLDVLRSIEDPAARLIRILLDEDNDVSMRGATILRNCALVGGPKWQAILQKSSCQQSIASVLPRANAGTKELLKELLSLF